MAGSRAHTLNRHLNPAVTARDALTRVVRYRTSPERTGMTPDCNRVDPDAAASDTFAAAAPDSALVRVVSRVRVAVVPDVPNRVHSAGCPGTSRCSSSKLPLPTRLSEKF